MRGASDINNTLSTNQMSNAFQNNFSAQIFCENIWQSFNIESFLSRTANIAKRVCVSKVNVVSLKYLKVSSFYRTDCYIHQKAEARVVKQITKIARIAKAALHKLPGKSLLLSCLSCLSCLLCLSCLSCLSYLSCQSCLSWLSCPWTRPLWPQWPLWPPGSPRSPLPAWLPWPPGHQDPRDHDDHVSKLDVVHKQVRVWLRAQCHVDRSEWWIMKDSVSWYVGQELQKQKYRKCRSVC